jgi:hypothetical protein
MQLLQETGNKKHIFYEDVFDNEFVLSKADLVYYELLDSCVLSVLDTINRKIIAVKICELNSYKIDNWFNFNFNSKIEIKTQNSVLIPQGHSNVVSKLVDGTISSFEGDLSNPNLTVVSLYSKNIVNTDLLSSLYVDYIDSKILFILYNRNNIEFSHSELCQTFDEFWYFMFNMLKVNNCDIANLQLGLGVNFYTKYPELFQILDSYFENVEVLKSNFHFQDYPLLREKLFLIDCFLK